MEFIMFYKTSLPIFSIALILAPINFLNAQETANKGCSALTEIGDSGKIIWSTSADVSALVADVQILDIPAPEFHSVMIICQQNKPHRSHQNQKQAKRMPLLPQHQQLLRLQAPLAEDYCLQARWPL